LLQRDTKSNAYTYMYIYIHVYISTYIHIYVYISTKIGSKGRANSCSRGTRNQMCIRICIFTYMYIYIYIYTYICIHINKNRFERPREQLLERDTKWNVMRRSQPTLQSPAITYRYGVATISRLLKFVGLFCKRDLQKRPIFCKRDL